MTATEADRVRTQIRQISSTAIGTLTAFTVLVLSLPVADYWAGILPSPGSYEVLALSLAMLISVMLAYREVRHEWKPDPTRRDSRPDGKGLVVLGAILTMIYIATSNRTMGTATELILAALYVAIMTSFSWGFVRLSKKAFDWVEKREKDAQMWANLAKRTAELEQQTAQLRRQAAAKSQKSTSPKKAGDQELQDGSTYSTPASPGLPDTSPKSSDTRFFKFTTVFFATLVATVTGFAIINEIVALIPPIIAHTTVAEMLAVLLSVMFVGSNYTKDFLVEDLVRMISRSTADLQRRLAGRNVVEAGLGPTLAGIALLAIYLFFDGYLDHKTSTNMAIEILLIGLYAAFYTCFVFGIWRLGVNEYNRLTARR